MTPGEEMELQGDPEVRIKGRQAARKHGIWNQDPLRYRQHLEGEYGPIFEQYDGQKIPLADIEKHVDFSSIARSRRKEILAKADANRDGVLDFEEFLSLMTSLNKKQRVTRLLISSVIPARGVDDKTVSWYIEEYSFCPPPVFMILASLIEIAFFVAYAVQMSGSYCNKMVTSTGPAPLYSPLIYNPNRRYEVWRYMTYMLLHSGIIHITSNLIIQLVVGLPLEMVHSWRIIILYCIGVVGGSLAHSVTSQGTFLLGASGGVYTVLGAHLANLIINWKEMAHDWTTESRISRLILSAPVRLVFWLLIVGLDMGFAIYGKYYAEPPSSVGVVAHAGGLVTGILLGIPLLRNLNKTRLEMVFLIVSTIIFLVFFTFAVVYNLIADGYPPVDNSSLPGAQFISPAARCSGA